MTSPGEQAPRSLQGKAHAGEGSIGPGPPTQPLAITRAGQRESEKKAALTG